MIEILVGRSSSVGAGLQLLLLDATIAQDHVYNNKVSSYPVETGLSITDHVMQEPDVIKIEGLVSDASLIDAKDLTSTQGAKYGYDILCGISGRTPVESLSDYPSNEYPAPILVDIICKHRVFTDMICESLTFPFTNTTGAAVQFSASFRKIRKVDISFATINFTATKVKASVSDLSALPVDQGNVPTENMGDRAVTSFGNTLDKINEKITNFLGG